MGIDVNDKSNIIFFDGVCNFCNFWVSFVIKNDPKGDFTFSSLQSDFAMNFLKKNGIKSDFQTIIFFSEGKFLTQSDAVLSILNKNGGFNKFLYQLFKKSDYIILARLFNYLGLSYEKNHLYWIRRDGLPNGRASFKRGLQCDCLQ